MYVAIAMLKLSNMHTNHTHLYTETSMLMYMYNCMLKYLLLYNYMLLNHAHYNTALAIVVRIAQVLCYKPQPPILIYQFCMSTV